jgi:hypothetical protein
MRTPKKRHTVVAALALALSALPAVTAISPAHAAVQCLGWAGPTPSVEVDTNNDGNVEVRVPSLSNISVCAAGNVFTDTDVARVEPCSFVPMSCWRLLVTPQVGAEIESDLSLCRAIDRVTSCSRISQPRWGVATPAQPTLCIGIDLNGGFPCGGGTALVAFQ